MICILVLVFSKHFKYYNSLNNVVFMISKQPKLWLYRGKRGEGGGIMQLLPPNPEHLTF